MAEKVGYFSVKSIGLSRVNGRKPCTLLDAARHNLREIQAELGAGGNIDPSRTHCNAVLHGPPSAAEVEVLAGVMLSAAGINASKLRSDHCQAIEAMFSLSPDKFIHDRSAYFAQCLTWVAGAMSIPVLSAVIHRDEAAEHLHVLLLPLKDGAHVGCKLIERAPLMRLRDNFFSKVAGPAGFKRGRAKMQGIVKQWAIAAVLSQCEALGLPDANGALWPITVAAIERDPTAAVLALGINVNTIRPSDRPAQMGCTQNPVGIEESSQNPIWIKKALPAAVQTLRDI